MFRCSTLSRKFFIGWRMKVEGAGEVDEASRR